mgnify:CR=1 FL=1
MSGSRDPTWVFPAPCAEKEVRSIATRWDIPLTVAEILLRRVSGPDSAARDDAISRFLNPSFVISTIRTCTTGCTGRSSGSAVR